MLPRSLIKAILIGTVLVVSLVFVVHPALAENPVSAQESALLQHAPTFREREPEHFEAFFDEIIAKQLEMYHVPGATVSIVKDGAVAFSKGYGYANVEKQIPFDPDTSLVRIASISKLFTWTAVMQLVEQGKLDLNADVNTYLTTFKVPATYPQPITLAHLMTHTAGFEERTIGTSARNKQDVQPLGEYLAGHLPARVRPPGQISSYSNQGAALAGYIVSEVAGMPYEQYIQEHILAPLDMDHTTAWEPVPQPLLADLAGSYDYVDDAYKPVPFKYDLPVPDGSISASATDMAHFMIAHLQDGRYIDTRILQASTAQQMHTQSFTHHPRLNGWAHGFMEQRINNQRVISHDGSWEAFQSVMMLVPQHNLGLFISYNSYEGIDAGTELIPAFFDHFFPVSEPSSTQPPVHLEQPVQQYAGWYRRVRSSRTTIEKVLMLLGSNRMIAVDADTLQFNGREWVAVEPLLYRDADGTDLMALLPNEQGAITYVTIGRSAYERIPWYENVRFNLAVLGAWAVLSLSALIGWPVGALIQRRRKEGQKARPASARIATWAAALGCGLGLIFVVLFTFVLEGDTSEFLYGAPFDFSLLMVLPIVITALTALALASTVLAWKDRYWSLWGRLHYTIVVLGMVACVWLLNTWNLLGFRYG